MKHILLLLLSFFVPVVWGQQVEQFKLWPDKPEAGEAEIFVYHPAKGGKAAPAVLICPGGGYRGLAMNHEGHDMAKWYASNVCCSRFEIQDAGRCTYDSAERCGESDVCYSGQCSQMEPGCE